MPDDTSYLHPLVTLFAASFAAHGMRNDTALDAARQVVAGLPAAVGDALDARGEATPPGRVLEHASEVVAALVASAEVEWPFRMEPPVCRSCLAAGAEDFVPVHHVRSPAERTHLAEVPA